MTAQDDPYVRVYYRVLNDDKFKPLTAAAWGHWVRLLVIADGMFPASAPLPRWVEDAPLHELVERRIVDLEGDYFRIHGMEPERSRRADSATFAADVKHHGLPEAERRRSARSALASDRMRAQPLGDAPHVRKDAPQPFGSAVPASPLLSAPLQSNPSQAIDAPAFDVMLLVENLTRRPFNYREGHQVHDTLAGDVAAHGADRIADEYRRFRESSPGPVDAAQIVFGVHNALHPLTKPKAMSEAELREAGVKEAIRLVQGGKAS